MEEDQALTQVLAAGGEPVRMIFAFLLVAIGLLHLGIPRRLLAMRGWWMERTIGAKFIPSERTVFFYRIFGMLVLLAGAFVWLRADGMRVTDTQQPSIMQGYVTNIEKATLENTDYRRVLYTAKNSQLVLMSLQPGDEIGMETHQLDQFIRIEQGRARAILDGVEHDLEDDFAIVIPAGTRHNVINTGEGNLKLYSVYSPPEHKDGTVHATKADEKEEHFDGVTTE